MRMKVSETVAMAEWNRQIQFHHVLYKGLGTLYTRGTIAMNNLLLCHITESVTTKELKLFLRAFHMSGLASNPDLLFIFSSILTPQSFDDVIREENEFFLKVIGRYKAELCNESKAMDFPASFDLTKFVKSGKKVTEKGEPIWGGKIKMNDSSLKHSVMKLSLSSLQHCELFLEAESDEYDGAGDGGHGRR